MLWFVNFSKQNTKNQNDCSPIIYGYSTTFINIEYMQYNLSLTMTIMHITQGYNMTK